MLDGLAGKKMVQMLSEEQKMALAKALEPTAPAADSDSPIPLDVSITTCFFFTSSLVHSSLQWRFSHHTAFQGSFDVSNA